MALGSLYASGTPLRCISPIAPLQIGVVYWSIGERPFIHSLDMVSVAVDGKPVDQGRPFFKWRFKPVTSLLDVPKH